MNETTLHPARSMGFLSRLHDGELSEAESADFLRHRGECAECAASADEYEAVLALYRESGEVPADPRLSKRILANLDARLEKPTPRRFLTFNVDLVLASVAIVCLIGALIAYSIVSPNPVSIPKAARTLYVKILGEKRQAPAVPSPPVSIASREVRAKRAAAPGTAKDDEEAQPVLLAETGVARGDDTFDNKIQRNAPAPAGAPVPQALSAAPEAASPVGEGVRDELEKKASSAQLSFVAPTLVRRVEPVIPSAAKRLSLGSSPVVLEAKVDESGDVRNIRIIRSNPLFDRPVEDAVRQWKYRPALLAGKPVAVKLTVTLKIEAP